MPGQYYPPAVAALGAEPLPITRPTDRAAEIEQLVCDYRGAVPGAAVLIVRDGELLLRHAGGQADLENGIAVTAATNFRLASVSKQFTAAAVLLLAEEGRLRLDDPIRNWLPTLPQALGAVRIRHLLDHTSGIIDYEDLIPATHSAQLHDKDVLWLLEAEERTYFAPGSQYRYGDSGYALAALIVANAAAQDYAEFLRRRIFLPLGMHGTVAYQESISAVAQRAFGYSATAAGWTRTDQSKTSAVLGDGGIYSSIDDLARWDAALYDSRLLQPQSLRHAFAPAIATDDPNLHYGLGWRISGESVWHSGETLGFRSVIVRYPRRRFTVVMLTNRNAPETYTTALALAKLFFPEADAGRATQVVAGPDCGAHPLSASER